MWIVALALIAAPIDGPAAAPADIELKPIAGEISITSRSPEAAVLFRDGRLKSINWDCPAASILFKKALELDPDFPLALAWLGECQLGAEGAPNVVRAVGLSKDLPAAERISIEAIAAKKRGDDELMRSLRRRLVDLAPNDWLPQFQMGVQAQYDHKSQAAILYLDRAVKLNPQLAEAYNYLGYVLAQQGMAEEGVAAAKRFIDLKPDEPNAYDSYGEVLLLIGRMEEAEAQFRKAEEMSSAYWMSWVGIAYIHFYRGDFAGGHDALAKARKAPRADSELRSLALADAWAFLGEGKNDAALSVIDGLERDATAKKAPIGIAWARLERAEMLVELGRYEDGHAQVASARAALNDAGSGVDQSRLRRALLELDAVIGARENQPEQAKRAVAELDEELRRSPSNADLRAELHRAEGAAAVAMRDFSKAAEKLSLCPENAVACRFELERAQEISGQTDAAEETRTKLLSRPRRDFLHRGEDPTALYIRLKMTRKQLAAH